MFDIGFSELLLFGFIALIVLGPEKLPQAARTAGRWYAKFRRTVTTLQSEIEAELDLAETRQKMQEELAKIKQAEAEMKREMAELRGSMKEFEQAQNQELKGNPASGNKALSKHTSTEQSQHNIETNGTVAHDAPIEPHQIDATTLTRPWEHMWFRLGIYDKERRLPPAPFLPNYRAEALLHSSSMHHEPTAVAPTISMTKSTPPPVAALSKEDS